jgi:hypothetical protein
MAGQGEGGQEGQERKSQQKEEEMTFWSAYWPIIKLGEFGGK